MADQATERFVAQLPQLLAELEQRAAVLFEATLSPSMAGLPALRQIVDFLWQMRASFDERDRQINVLLLGAYLGEIVRREQGGRWRVAAAHGLPVVDLPDGQEFSPMVVMGKWLKEGEEPEAETIRLKA